MGVYFSAAADLRHHLDLIDRLRHEPNCLRHAGNDCGHDPAAQGVGRGFVCQRRLVDRHVQKNNIAAFVLPALVNGWIFTAIVVAQAMGSVIMLYSHDSIVLSVLVWELWSNGDVAATAALGVLLIFGLMGATFCRPGSLPCKISSLRGELSVAADSCLVSETN